MDKEHKSLLEIKKNQRNIQNHINKVYNICSALYQEIQDVKQFVNYKHDDSLGDVESSTTQLNNNPNSQKYTMQNQIQNSINVLDNVEDFTEKMPRNRKMKVVDN